MSFARMGLTGLNNASQSFSIGSWGLDDLIVQQATVALSGRFQAQPVGYQRAAFAAIKDSPVAPVNLIRGDPFKKLVQTDVSPQGLDAYIVITKAKSNFGNGARKVEGIGFISYGTLLASYNQIHALYEIRVFDGKSFEIIEKMAAPPLEHVATVGLTGPRPAGRRKLLSEHRRSRPKRESARRDHGSDRTQPFVDPKRHASRRCPLSGRNHARRM
jgi:hypothetical protein